MAKQTVGIGAVANDNTGDTPRVAFGKVNDNFTELYPNVKIGRITPSITASQNDYSPAGWDDASYVDISSDSSAWRITGFAAPTATGKTIKTLYNPGSTVINIPIESASSSAANRVKACSMVINIHPGCSFTMEYNSSISRWMSVADLCSSIWTPDPRSKFIYVNDFMEAYAGNVALALSSGSGATPVSSTYGIFAQKVMGAWQVATGSTSTGRSGLGFNAGTAITCALGRFMSFCRVGINTLSTSGEEYSLKVGGFFSYTVVPGSEVDGIGWGYDRTVDGDFWICNTCNNSTRTKTVSVATTTNYIWLGVITNDDWTAVEYVYGNDGINWTRAALHTTNIPTSSRTAIPMLINAIKSNGTTSRITSIDAAMYYYQFLRG